MRSSNKPPVQDAAMACVAHLQIVAHDLFHRIAVVRENKIPKFFFDLSNQLIDSRLRGFDRSSASLYVELDFSGSSQDRGLHIRIELIDGRNSRVALRLAQSGNFQFASGNELRWQLGAQAL